MSFFSYFTNAYRKWRLHSAQGQHGIVPRDAHDYNALNAISALCHCDVRGKKVLVIGCNTGLDCSYFLSAGAKEIHGVDVVVDIGKDFQEEKITYHRHSAEHMGFFHDDGFDLVYSFATLEHIHDIESTFREMFRCLKPGGIIYSIAAPLWNSRFGHHKADFFFDFPWIHLLLSKQEIIEWFIANHSMDLPEKAENIESHVEYMLDRTYFNMRPGKEYLSICAALGAEILCNQIDYEPDDLLTPEALEKLVPAIGKDELLGVTHRFIARKGAYTSGRGRRPLESTPLERR